MAFKVVQTFVLTTSTSAQSIDISAATAIARQNYSGYIQAIITTETSSLVVIFGDSTVTADDTITSNAYPLGNYYCLAGTVQDIDILKGSTTASVKAAGAGSVKISIGWNTGD